MTVGYLRFLFLMVTVKRRSGKRYVARPEELADWCNIAALLAAVVK